MKTILTEVYERQPDGTNLLIETFTTEVEENVEQQIAEREAQLLAIYEELQALKNSQSN